MKIRSGAEFKMWNRNNDPISLNLVDKKVLLLITKIGYSSVDYNLLSAFRNHKKVLNQQLS